MNSSMRISPGGMGSSIFGRVALCDLSVVVDDLDIVGIASLPSEADAPLVVDANAVLAPAVALERLPLIAGRGRQVLENSSAVQIEQLPASRPLDGPEPPNRPVVEQFLHALVLEGPDHTLTI
jgi:hypothetical protein